MLKPHPNEALAFILITCFWICSLTGTAQRVTLQVHEAPLQKVLTAIAAQTDTFFLYTEELMRISKPVSVTARNASLTEILDRCFIGQPLSYIIMYGTVVITEKNRGGREIHGIHIAGIVTCDGEELGGVSVSMKNGTLGTLTDETGRYLLTNVVLPVTLVFSCIGYNDRELTLRDHHVMELQMTRSPSLLAETIVKGYYTESKRLSTGSVSLISSRDIKTHPAGDPLSAIEGRVPGIFISQVSGVPGAVVKVQIRGQNGIQPGREPLYLINGVPFGPGTLNETIGGGADVTRNPLTMLNPDDIADIQFLKDADATTIYGSHGANGVVLITLNKGRTGKTRIDMGISGGAGKATRTLPVMNNRQYIDMRYEAFANDGIDWRSVGSAADDLLLWDTSRSTDWQKTLIGRTAPLEEFNTRISGGSAHTGFSFSQSFGSAGTVYPGHLGEKRVVLNLSANHESVDKKLHIQFTSLYATNVSRLPPVDLLSYIFLPPVAPAVYHPDGTLNWANNTWDNPFRNLIAYYENQSKNLLTDLQSTYHLPAGLDLKINIGFNRLTSDDAEIKPLAFYSPSIRSDMKSSAGFKNVRLTTLIVEPQVNYTKTSGGMTFAISSGVSYQHTSQRSLSAAAMDFSDEISLPVINTGFITRDAQADYRYRAVYGRININLRDKYLVNITARRDGPHGGNPSESFSNFGAAGIGWIFSDYSSSNQQKQRSYFGKLRASIGVSGNDQRSDYFPAPPYVNDSYIYSSAARQNLSGLSDPRRRSERTLKTEAGLEMAFFDRRLSAEMCVYSNRSSDQPPDEWVSVTAAGNNPSNPEVVVLNQGIELSLTFKSRPNHQLTFSNTFNLSANRNTLKDYPVLSESVFSGIYTIGHSLYAQRGFHFTGLDTRTGLFSFQDVNRDGAITYPDDYLPTKILGPKYYGGLSQTLEYRKFQLDLFIQFVRQQGKTIGELLPPPGFRSNQPTRVIDRWIIPGDQRPGQPYTTTQGVIYQQHDLSRYSDINIGDASYIRLKNIQLSFTLAKSALARLGFTACRLFVQGQNMVTWTKYFGLDPETQLKVPPLKEYLAGVKLSL